jgi:hypothetical protein
MADSIRFAAPEGLELRRKSLGDVELHQFRHPTARMELNLLFGAWEALAKAATPTSVRYEPPSGKAMTDADREALGRIFLGAVHADLNVDLVGSGEEPAKSVEERAGRTARGCVFAAQLLESAGGVAQGTTVVFDPASSRAALVAFRSAAAHVADARRWSEEVVQSIAFAGR